MRREHFLIAIAAALALGQRASCMTHAQTGGLTLSPVGYTGGRFELRINGPPSRVYRVDSSTDLVNWSVLSENLTGGTLLVEDPAAQGLRYRFYRASANPEVHSPGQGILALQGLRSNTLVAGKITALRVFTDELTYSAANRIETTIFRPDGSRLLKSWPHADFVAIPNSSQGRSLVVRVPGADLPWIGGYHFEVSVLDVQGALLASYSLDQAQLLPTKDLLVGIDRLWAGSVNPGTPQEIRKYKPPAMRWHDWQVSGLFGTG